MEWTKQKNHQECWVILFLLSCQFCTKKWKTTNYPLATKVGATANTQQIGFNNGNGHVGSAGAAIGEPKFLFLQSNQGTQDGDGLDDFDSTKQISGNTITHKIPIVVNGETYFLLANSTEADVAAGNYKVLATPA